MPIKWIKNISRERMAADFNAQAGDLEGEPMAFGNREMSASDEFDYLTQAGVIGVYRLVVDEPKGPAAKSAATRLPVSVPAAA